MKVHELVAMLQTKNQDADVKWNYRTLKTHMLADEFMDLAHENIHEGKEGEVYDEGELVVEGTGNDFIVIGVPVY